MGFLRRGLVNLGGKRLGFWQDCAVAVDAAVRRELARFEVGFASSGMNCVRLWLREAIECSLSGSVSCGC